MVKAKVADAETANATANHTYKYYPPRAIGVVSFGKMFVGSMELKKGITSMLPDQRGGSVHKRMIAKAIFQPSERSSRMFLNEKEQVLMYDRYDDDCVRASRHRSKSNSPDAQRGRREAYKCLLRVAERKGWVDNYLIIHPMKQQVIQIRALELSLGRSFADDLVAIREGKLKIEDIFEGQGLSVAELASTRGSHAPKALSVER